MTPEQQGAFDDLLREISELRPLAATAQRILAVIDDDEFSAQDLADTIRADQALTLRLLRIANSPFLGMPRRIETVRDAVVLMGVREVRSMALSACVIDTHVSSPGFDYSRFWVNSVVVGTLAQVLAEAELEDDEYSFTAGVVHNIGRLVMAQNRPDWIRECIRVAQLQDLTVHRVQMQLLGFTDADIGAAVARQWSFPALLCDAVLHHATPAADVPDQTSLERHVAAARTYAMAKGVTDGLEIVPSGYEPDPVWSDPAVQRILDRHEGLEGIVTKAESFLEGAMAI